ncbi:MAG: hypothetical protein R3194_06140 [Limnobacter sp.]|nr:hypothetical protein [Limnobacter sp.]
MNTFISTIAFSGLLALSSLAQAQNTLNPGTNDDQVGSATRAMLQEQRDGINRGKQEPYKAESAGKALRAYTDSIGKPAQAVKSQLDGVE